MTDPLGQSQVLPYIINLTKENYNFHLISFEKSDRYTVNKSFIEKISLDNNIEWHPIKYTKTPPIFSTLWDMVKLNQKIKILGRKNVFDMIHCRSYIPAIFGLKYKRKWNTKLLFDMRGLWADERVDGELWNLKNPIYKLIYNYFKKKEKQFLIHSDHTISLTHNGKKNIINRSIFSHLKKNISVIPCCTDLNLFKPIDRDSNSFIIGYLGSLGTWYLLKEMLVFFKKINEKIPDSKFHFLTKDNPDIIFNYCDNLGIDIKNILIEESDREDIPYKTRNWNFSLCFIKPSFSKIFSSPTKQGELMAMGIPIICNSGVGDVDFIVEKYKSGFVLKDLNKVNFEIILNANFKKQKLIEGANQYFSLEKGVISYLKIYRKIC
jgi:glycosyltransferase involved in cell wall biosynthesis